MIVRLLESMCEHIVANYHVMKTDDWKICVNFLFNDQINNKVNLSIIYLDMKINFKNF